MKNQNDIQDKNTFKTTNFALAAALALFEPLEDIQWKDTKTAEFIFEKNVDLESYVNMYFSNTLRVEPQTYYNQLKLMKSRLHERI